MCRCSQLNYRILLNIGNLSMFYFFWHYTAMQLMFWAIYLQTQMKRTSNFSNLHLFFINKRHLVCGYLAMIAPFNCSKVSILNWLVNKIVECPYTTNKFKHFTLLLSLSSSFESTANSLIIFYPTQSAFSFYLKI